MPGAPTMPIPPMLLLAVAPVMALGAVGPASEPRGGAQMRIIHGGG